MPLVSSVAALDDLLPNALLHHSSIGCFQVKCCCQQVHRLHPQGMQLVGHPVFANYLSVAVLLLVAGGGRARPGGTLWWTRLFPV